MVDDIKRNCEAQGNDKLRMSIYHPSLKLAIFIPYTNASDLSGELITQEIEKKYYRAMKTSELTMGSYL